MSNQRIVFEIGAKIGSSVASESQKAGQQAGQAFTKGFTVGADTRKFLQGMSPQKLAAFLKQNKELRDSLAREYMEAQGLFKGKTPWATSGGSREYPGAMQPTGEYPVEKNTAKFGVASRQVRQAMNELNPALKDFKRLMGEAFQGMQWNVPGTTAGKRSPHLAAYINQSMGIGAKGYNPGSGYVDWWRSQQGMLSEAQEKRRQAGYARIEAANEKERARKAKEAAGMGELRTGPNWKMAVMGGISGMFSSWIGARLMSEAFSKEPMKGGAKGALSRVVFGAGGEFGFAEAYVALQGLKFVIREFFQVMSHAVDEGSKLYQQAASVGMRTQQVAHLQAMFTGIGLSPDLARRMITQARMGGTRAGVFTDVGGMAMRAQLSGASIEEVNQIRNMRNELKWVADNSKFAATVLGDTAGSMQRISMMTSVMKLEWTAMWSQVADSMEPIIVGAEATAAAFMRLGTWLAWFAKFAPIFGGLSTSSFQNLAKAQGLGTGPGNSWMASAPVHPVVGGNPYARIGFTFGNFGGNDYGRQIAHNTKRTADALSRGASGHGGWDMPLLAAHNMPA